ncbi:MAG: hypothetical protein H0U16_10105 [Actinobacteria bacterium]|nr:hypothetical protein [Actinomycetota bacterium]
MNTIIEYWPPEKGILQRRLDIGSSEHWDPKESPPAHYVRHLKSLGIKKDPTEASMFYERAMGLRLVSGIHQRKTDESASIGERLVSGEISAAEASALLAKLPFPNAAAKEAEREQAMMSSAVRNAYSAAIRALHGYSEDKWLKLLRPIAQEAAKTRDQTRWDAVHAFAAFLRTPSIAGLSMLATDPAGRRDVEAWRYQVARPDLYHRWRLDHAVASQNIRLLPAGEIAFVWSVITEGPSPGIVDLAKMGPGLYSAAEVLAHTEAILDEQEKFITRAEPAPRSRRTPAEVTS